MFLIFAIIAAAVWVTVKELAWVINATVHAKTKFQRISGIIALISCALMISMIFIGH